MRLSRREIFFGTILLISFILTVTLFYTYQILNSPNLRVNLEKKILKIPQGTTFPQLLEIMEEDSILYDKLSFAFLSKVFNYQENVKPGRYLIPANMNNLAAIRMLRSGRQNPLKLTFNNIRNKEEFAEKVGEKMAFGKEELLKVLEDSLSAAQYGFDSENFISMFLPNTYELYWTTSLDDFLARMHQEYQKFWNKERQEKAKNIGLSPQEVSTLASIVQSETNQNPEKPTVAGVYMNRLQEGMRLEADPTLIFALNDYSIRRVLNRHKEVESPYNTYRYSGLPPGPIRMASPSSIDAVLNYQKHDYLFFCAKADFSGYHAFAETHEEHLKNARLFQKALDQRGIK